MNLLRAVLLLVLATSAWSDDAQADHAEHLQQMREKRHQAMQSQVIREAIGARTSDGGRNAHAKNVTGASKIAKPHERDQGGVLRHNITRNNATALDKLAHRLNVTFKFNKGATEAPKGHQQRNHALD